MPSRPAMLQQQQLAKPKPIDPTATDAPQAQVAIDPGWPAIRQALASVYNRIGGYIERQSADAGIDASTVLAVWYVESAGRSFTPNQAIIRFENHILFNLWGKNNPDTYDSYFRHGGRPPATSDACRGPDNAFASWLCHAYRRDVAAPFVSCHTGQAEEYDILQFARSLAGDEVALQCISMGGCQVMGFNYDKLGFASAREMFDAFQATESAQVRGFFAFCEHCGTSGQAMASLKNRDWATFATLYNGSGNVAKYASLLANAEAEARRIVTRPEPAALGAASAGNALLSYARTLKGVPYEINLAGESPVPGSRGYGKRYPDPDKGLDCSGFVLNVLQNNGLLQDLNPDLTSCDTLWSRCNEIDRADANPGDLVFFAGTYSTPGKSHIGIVTEPGGTAMISARSPGVDEDVISSARWGRFLAGFGRLKS